MNSPRLVRSPRLLRAMICAGLLGAAWGCQPPGDAPAADAGAPDAAPRKARRVTALALEPQRFEEQLELPADITAPNDATLSARGAGTVKAIVELGATVTENQVVAKLDASAPEAAVAQAAAGVAQAEAALGLAEENHRRQKPLHDRKIISDLEFQQIAAQLDQARAAVKQARAAVRAARTQVGFYEVIAPFAGTVEQRFVEAGEQINPGQPVVRIIDTRLVRVQAGVPERFANDVRQGSTLKVRFNAYGMADRDATVTFVGRTIDPRSRTFTIEAELQNEDGQLKPAMIARIALTRSATEGALVVPQTAVLRDEEGASVFLVGDTPKGPVARRARVELGPASGNAVSVAQGLKAGDRVVVLGQNALNDGDPISLGDEPAKAPASAPKSASASAAPKGGAR
ncbi:MAG: efflux RND transporter periplasmic adaptor subunit [Myxococcales bacterium]|nr:efflux RND transporter periplasmic adaptor subunit [Myxococcales bacterium]